MVMPAIDITGRKFGRLTVLHRASYTGYSALWMCRCDCGKEKAVRSMHLRSGASASCGCVRPRFIGRVKHGESRRSKEYTTWLSIVGRCHNPNNTSYDRYGGRGIRVCERWRANFSVFLADMGRRPNGHSIERMNNDGDYTPDNCKWIHSSLQGKNRSTTTQITLDGQTLCQADWCRKYGISSALFRNRRKRGMDVVAALTTPVRSRR